MFQAPIFNKISFAINRFRIILPKSYQNFSEVMFFVFFLRFILRYFLKDFFWESPNSLIYLRNWCPKQTMLYWSDQLTHAHYSLRWGKKNFFPTRVENLLENRFSSFQKHSKGLLLPYLKMLKKYMKLHQVVEIEHHKKSFQNQACQKLDQKWIEK